MKKDTLVENHHYQIPPILLYMPIDLGQPVWTFLGLEYIHLYFWKQRLIYANILQVYYFKKNVSTHTIGNIMKEPIKMRQELFMKFRKLNELSHCQ